MAVSPGVSDLSAVVSPFEPASRLFCTLEVEVSRCRLRPRKLSRMISSEAGGPFTTMGSNPVHETFPDRTCCRMAISVVLQIHRGLFGSMA